GTARDRHAVPAENLLGLVFVNVHLRRTTSAFALLVLEEDVLEKSLGDLAVHFRDRRGEWNLLGADLNAVLSLAAVLNPSLGHQAAKSLLRVELAGRVHVEEAGLADRRRADEPVVDLHLRASLEAAGAGHARGEHVRGRLVLGGLARPGAQIVGAI